MRLVPGNDVLMPTGRFAPSPTGRLHLGNLRTALLAWLFARIDGGDLFLRFDDLDTGSVRPEHYQSQADDLLALGLGWDGRPIRQSDRGEHYREALNQLVADDVVYPCFCSRREIREAAQAPNQPFAGRHYPGTCRHLDTVGRNERLQAGRPPALRLRAEGEEISFDDAVLGPASFVIDDFVVQRNDGTPAYHLVTVIDDADLQIELVVRADDLADSTSRQIFLANRLGLVSPRHAHVPLILSPDGNRLAKRHGAVNLSDRADRGETPAEVRAFLAASLGLSDPAERLTPDELLARFDPQRLPTEPLLLTESYLQLGVASGESA